MKRTYYPKEFKQFALKEALKGRSFEEILRTSGFEIDDLLKKDKKYCHKLFHKWKKEFYQKKELLYFINGKITAKSLEEEIEILKNETQNDVIMEDIKEKIMLAKAKYQSIKQHITSKYLK